MIGNRRSVYASVAHRYWNGGWSHEKNREIYGDDASAEGWGSNLRLELDGGTPDQLALLKSKVDHECLFTLEKRFAIEASSVENIAVYLGGFLSGDWVSVAVWESENIGARVWRSGETDLLMKILNLTLTCRGAVDPASGLIADRRELRTAVQRTVREFGDKKISPRELWGRELFATLKRSVAPLQSVRIDLGRHEFLTIE